MTDVCPNEKYKWDNLEENMSNWEPIACLGILRHATFQCNGTNTTIFSSPMVNFCGDKTEYNFSTLAKEVRTVRDLDSHATNKENVFTVFDNNIGAILELLNCLSLWYENNGLHSESKSTNDAIALVKKECDLFKAKVMEYIEN